MKIKLIHIFLLYLITPTTPNLLSKHSPRHLTDNAFDEAEPDKDEKEEDGEEEEPDILESLYHRAFSINDKIDHLLFHHNHDLTGKQAQFTPYGVHFLPKYKGNDSIDQKLKMVDYMHTMGGYAPGAGFMTPYLFSHDAKGGQSTAEQNAPKPPM